MRGVTRLSHRGHGSRWRVAALSLVFLCSLAACTEKTDEERAREAEEEIDKSMPEVEATALAQPTNADIVKEVQKNLTSIHEYQGEINGVLDSVTLNALEAFQRSIGKPGNGILDEETRLKLAEAARKSG
jgi:peptidoglycan hydrolase-like protein with peptidoglycan-binding domain